MAYSPKTVILLVTVGIDFWRWPALNIDLKQYTRHYSVDKSAPLNNSSEHRLRNFKELLLVPGADVLKCWPSVVFVALEAQRGHDHKGLLQPLIAPGFAFLSIRYRDLIARPIPAH